MNHFQNNAILILLIISLYTFHTSAQEANIILLPDFSRTNKTILEESYPTDAQNDHQINTETLNCKKTIDLNVNKGRNSCQWFLNLCLQQTKQLTRTINTPNDFVPGTFVKLLDQSSVTKGLLPNKFFNQFRNPFDVKIFNGLTTTFRRLTTPQGFSQQLEYFLGKNLPYLNSQEIKLNIVYPPKIQKIFQSLGIAPTIYELLKIANASLKGTADRTKRIVLIFHQKLFSASVDFSQVKNGKTDNYLRVFFNENAIAMEQAKRLIQNLDNPLQFIFQANYGRLLILSLIGDDLGQGQIKLLEDCAQFGHFQKKCFKNTMLELIKNPSIRYYFAGVEESIPFKPNLQCPYCKKMVDWERVFFPFTAFSVKNLRPLSIIPMSFKGEKFVESEKIFFETLLCTKSVIIQIKDISNGTSLQVVLSNPKTRKQLFNATHPGTFEIGSEVGQEVFELKFLARGKRVSNGRQFFFLKNKQVYSIQVQFAMLINGEKRMSHIIGNSRSHKQFKGITLLIDPEDNRIISSQQYDLE